MSDPAPTRRTEEAPSATDELGHPRGTLALVILYGVLFGVGWLAMYVFRFLPHGAPRP
jgi:hypothetical protein